MSDPQILRPGQAAEIDTGLRRFTLAVYNYMVGGLVITGAVAYVTAATGLYQRIASSHLLWLVLLAPLGLVVLLSFRVEKMSLASARLTFWTYAVLVGVSLSAIFLLYTQASIAQTFFITSATFAAMSLFGYTTSIDLSRLGSFLLMGLIGLVIASLANLALRSSAVQFAVSVVGVLVFVGLTARDTQRIKNIYETADTQDLADRKAILGALALYLDFLNIFLFLLQLFGGQQRR